MLQYLCGTIGGIWDNGACNSGSGTKPGSGAYYDNDTPNYIPFESPEDNMPGFDSNSLLSQFEDSPIDSLTYSELAAGVAFLTAKGYGTAALLLANYFSTVGMPAEISPAQMAQDIPQFNDAVKSEVAAAESKGFGAVTTGWQSTSVNKLQPGAKSKSESDWYYAMNGFQYSIQALNPGDGKILVTVDVFKHYNWGNDAGGEARALVGAMGVQVNQNDIEQLATDGDAQDFNVWGSSTARRITESRVEPAMRGRVKLRWVILGVAVVATGAVAGVAVVATDLSTHKSTPAPYAHSIPDEPSDASAEQSFTYFKIAVPKMSFTYVGSLHSGEDPVLEARLSSTCQAINQYAASIGLKPQDWDFIFDGTAIAIAGEYGQIVNPNDEILGKKDALVDGTDHFSAKIEMVLSGSGAACEGYLGASSE